jgi:hypothetical protein
LFTGRAGCHPPDRVCGHAHNYLFRPAP